MKKLEAESKEIERKMAELKGNKERLLEQRNNINQALTNIEIELLKLQGEQRLAEKLKSDTSKSSDQGDNL